MLRVEFLAVAFRRLVLGFLDGAEQVPAATRATTVVTCAKTACWLLHGSYTAPAPATSLALKATRFLMTVVSSVSLSTKTMLDIGDGSVQTD